jgi:hypothetical protein
MTILNGTPFLNVRVSASELHTILASLRYYQAHNQGQSSQRLPVIDEIATNGGQVIPLDTEAIDRLCERLNLDSF